MKKIVIYYHTVRNLKPIQIFYRLKYMLKRKLYEKMGGRFFKKIETKTVNQKKSINKDPRFILNDRTYYHHDLKKVLNNELTFLNVTHKFRETIDWHKKELNHGTRLWKLNLNYHEFLFDIALNYRHTGDKEYLEYIEKTIYDWVEQNPLGTKDYGKDNWNSYAISLRVVSWIKIYILLNLDFSKEFETFFLRHLRIQLQFLSENLEFDILGNHLIKNWKALIFGKYFFSTSIFDGKIKNLDKLVYCQFSTSGMHEEHSPMYAGIVLEDLLEVLLFEPKNQYLTNLVHAQYKNVCLLSNDNQYLFFNDSANKNGIDFLQIQKFYSKVLTTNKDLSEEEVFNVDGFIGLKTKKEHLVFDCAEVVAGNQPGHVQCDALSFEYFLNGRKIFTNSGTFEYNAGSKRKYSRSTESHNTLKYNSFDQSEVWGSFRTARMAKVSYKVNDLTLNKIDVEARVKGYDFSKDVVFKRRILKESNYLLIEDLLKANTNEQSQIFFHLGPNLILKNYGIYDVKSNKQLAKIQSTHEIETTVTDYYPEFGVVEQKQTLVAKNINPNDKVTTKIVFDA